jgi:hypothetical protein
MSNGGTYPIPRDRLWLLSGILVLSFASVLIRVISHRFLTPLTILWIGLPTALAAVLALTPKPGTSLVGALKNTTLGLLILAILLAEKSIALVAISPVVYLVAIAVGWVLDREASSTAPGSRWPSTAIPEDPRSANERLHQKRLRLLGICLTFTIVSLLYRVLHSWRLETSALLFVGLPTLLAILLIYTARPKGALGMALAGVTFALLLSAILFGEGLVCILMAAPLCYLAAAVVGVALDSRRSKKNTAAMLLAPLLLTSLEGAGTRLSLPREEAVTVRRTIAATPEEIRSAMAAPSQFRTALPVYLRLGFPRPVQARGSGLTVGAERVIHFAGGEGRPGDLVMRVEQETVQGVTFRAISDQSKIAHWLRWEEAEVSWRAVAAWQTEVTWTLRYRRGLDPAWYFIPWERYAVSLAGDYLIENVATPSR